MKKKFNILFDLDGTLTDPQEGITGSIKYSLEKLGETIPDNLDWCIGPPLSESYQKILTHNSPAAIQQAIAYYRERFEAVGLYENKIFPYIPELLQFLNESGHQLFVATAKPTIYAKKIIKHFKMDVHFKEIYGSELDYTRMDKGELITYLLQQELIAPEQTYMIGDREHDLIGARKNGITALAVLYGYGSYAELSRHNPHKMFNSPAEIKDFFEKI
jgi:phosphoglycolate phosphatase